MTERTISSRWTFIMKFVFPALWIGGFSLATLAMFRDGARTGTPDATGLPLDIRWMFLLVTVVGTLFIYWFCIRLKRVTMDRDVLRISNYLHEEAVPLSDIEDVTELRWVNLHPVTLHFYRPTDFGSSITFMPTVRFFNWPSHPIVDELRRAAARARGMPATPPA